MILIKCFEEIWLHEDRGLHWNFGTERKVERFEDRGA